MKYLFSILLLFSFTVFFAQSNEKKSLLKEAIDGLTLLATDPQGAFEEAKNIEAKALEIKAVEAELKALQIQCEYYKIKNDFIEIMETAKRLSNKSSQYAVPYYQVIAKRYLFDAYLFTGWHERAFQELEEGKEFINKLEKSDSLHVIQRSNYYIAYSNFYLLNEDYENQLKYLKLSGIELKNLPDGDYKERVMPIHYSNLASSFIKIEVMDSARHYARLSQKIHKENGRREVKFYNFMVLGKVGMSKTDFEEAVCYFKEAEGVIGYKNPLDMESLFQNMATAYEKLGEENLARTYRIKQDSVRLIISQNQNKSLHNLLREEREGGTGWHLYLLIILIFILIVIIFLVVRKNRVLAEQENKSAQFLAEFAKNPRGEDFSKLLDLLKENDPAFMQYFEESFPGFSTRLLEVNPKLSASDIEFCALLKLKISTKEMAQYKFRAPQTIRNKKYIIKNKLEIPKDTDIYEWFENL